MRVSAANVQHGHRLVPGNLARPWRAALSERTVWCENPGRFQCLS